MKEASSFSDAFPKQSQRLDKVMDAAGVAPSLGNKEFCDDVSAVSRDILRNDIDWQLGSGKVLSLTAKIKKNLKAQAQIIVNGRKHPVLCGGKCLACGKAFKPGEVVIMQNDGSNETVCLDCANPKTKISMSGETIVAVCG